MEASERQLPIEPGGPGSVRVLEDRIVIEDLTITDRETARVVRERAETGEEPARSVRRAIEIGTRVLDREDTAIEVDYVRREFERLTRAANETIEERNREAVERIEDGLRRALGGEEGPGALGQALDAHTEELSESIAATFGEDREGAVQAQIKRMLEQRDEEFLHRLTAEDERNPLGPMLATLRNWARERKEDQDSRDEKLEQKLDELLNRASELAGLDQSREALEAAEEAGTRKGRSFEERVDRALERIASMRGDASSHTGGEGAEGGGKKGDTLIELGAAHGPSAGRIVFEAKDKSLSKNEAWKELNEAMAARAASFAVLVVAGEDRIPSGREPLVEYEGNKLIVAVDREEPDGLLLEVAYRLAAARVAMAREQDMTVDAAEVRIAAEEAISCLKQAQSIRSTLTGIKTSSDKARATLDEMVEAVRARLERVESLIEVADADG
ncbi:MAG TPA: hypothetical protein VLB79_00380 [Solirubrobacterales bacterium]|nr:hypothetical protein [Solirubrobacterales bacterium]